MKRRRTTLLRPMVAVLAAAALLAGCAESDGDSDGTGGDGSSTSLKDGMMGEDSGGDPVQGGTMSLAAFAEPRSLDPAVTIASGATGGIEMANIYDTLVRFDSENKEFVPQLAESLEPNADHTKWTLTLRDGVKFSNGDPVDSAAVKGSQERYASLPAPEAALWNGNVAGISTPDETTVVYELKTSWPGFPSILSTGPGMIVAKASVGPGDKFTPIGAGPFTVGEWSPQESLTLEANPSYYGGKPNLDAFRIAYLSDQQTGLDSMDSGDMNAVFLRDPDKVNAAVGKKLPGYVNMVAASNMALINAAEGRPGSDARVRKAMQLATDSQLMVERAYNGEGDGSSTLFPDYSTWHSGTEGLEMNQDEAEQLLEEAKADGFDGKVQYIEASDPGSRASALAFKAQLEAVGFEVELNLVRSIADQINAIAVDRDYDVAAWGQSFREADPFSKMFSTMHSSGTQVYDGYTSPEMDTLIEKFQATADHDDAVALMDDIQKKVNEDVPFLNWGAFAEVSVWSEDVHGIIGGANSMILASEAWIG